MPAASLAPGRTNDMAMLQDRMKQAQTRDERAIIQKKIDFLVAEGKDKKLWELRSRLLKAAIANDNVEGDKISEMIFLHTRKIKV